MDTASAGYRIVIIGKNHDEKAKLGTFLTAKSSMPYGKLSKKSDVFSGEWRKTPVKVFNTVNLFGLEEAQVREEISDLCAQCPAGPNVLLLLVDPSDFTKTDRNKLRSILRCFGEDALKYSVVITTKSDVGWSPTLQKLKEDYSERYLTLNFNELTDAALRALFEKVVSIFEENQELYQSLSEMSVSSEPIYDEPNFKPLNIVLGGRYNDWKVTATSAILSQKPSTADLTRSRKHSGQVFGRTVSVVELPVLANVKENAAREECLQCLSLCDPDGIHAFIMVQPVGPLTSEDKDELRTLQREFSPKMNAFKMILFTVDSASVASAVSNFIKTNKDLQELCESCNNRFVILNVKNKDHVQNVIRMVENISESGSKSFTRQMTIKPRVKRGLTQIYPKRQSIFPPLKKEILTPTVIKESLAPTLKKESLAPILKKESLAPTLKKESLAPTLKKESLAPTLQKESLAPILKKESLAPTLQKESLALTPIKESLAPTLKKESLRIVLIGKTGCGKSASANTILGRDEFSSKLSQSSVTKFCKKAEGEIEGRSLVIVDTPGLFDTTLTNAEVQQELVKCVSLLAPGPHVFLLVLQIGRFTREEQETVHLIKEYFGDTAENFMIVVFTRGEELENTTLERYLSEGNPKAIALLEACGNRHHVLNNKDKDNRGQVTELLSKIEATVQKNGGKYYTSELFQQAEAAIEKETKRILLQKEHEIQEQQMYIEKKHKEQVRNTQSAISEIKAKIEHEIEERAKEVQEKQERLIKEQENRRKYEERREEEERIEKKQEKLHAKEWNQKYSNLVKKINEPSDSTAARNYLLIQKENLKREQMAWERERQHWWEKRFEEEKKLRKEENEKLAILEKEYSEAKKMYYIKKQEDELRRQTEEQEWRKIEESFQKQLEDIKLKNEEEARRQAEAFNDFQRTYARDRDELERMRERRKTADEYMLRYLTKSRPHRRDYNSLLLRHKSELEELEQLQEGADQQFLTKEISELQRQHEDERHEWIQERVSKVSGGGCAIL